MKIGMLIGSIGLVLGFQQAAGQAELALWSMSDVLQQDRINPALFHRQGIHIGFPSGMYNVFHTGPGYNTLIDTDGSPSRLRISEFYAQLSGENRLESDLAIQTFKIRFGNGAWNLGLEHEIRFHSQTDYPDALVELYVDGNQPWIGQTKQIGPSATIHALNSFGLLFSYQKDNITIGLRPKIYSGTHFGHTPQSSALLYTDPEFYQITLETDYTMHNVGLVAFEGANLFNYQLQTLDQYSLWTKNRGFGLDAGFHLDLNSEWEISAGMTDLGYIKWEDQIQTYSSNETIQYDGIDVLDPLGVEAIDLEGSLDSIKALFDLIEDNNAYTQRFTPHWHGMAQFHPSDRLNLTFQILYNSAYLQALNGGIYASYQLTPAFKFGGSLSSRYKKLNLGFHTSWWLRKWVLFLATDNIVNGVNPFSSNHFNVRAGLNFHLNGPLD